MKRMNYFLIMLKAFVVAYGFNVGEANAVLGVAPEVGIKIPTLIEEGGLVPIFLWAKNFNDDDKIKSVILSIDSNPLEHKKVFVAVLQKPQKYIFISTRFRMADAESGRILVEVISESGQKIVKEVSTGKISKPVNFNVQDSLNVTFKGGNARSIFAGSEIGQPKLVVEKGRTNSEELTIKGMLHHPMLPSIDGKQKAMIETVTIDYNGEQLVDLSIGDAMTNDPFIQVNIIDDKGVGKAEMIWKDSSGKAFEASN